MKKFGIAVIAASGLSAAVLGLASPAQAVAPTATGTTTISAGVDHLGWLDQIQPKVNVPKVDTTVRHSGR
ncbi:hypothetical protein [Mycolicibacterium sp. XJ870]